MPLSIDNSDPSLQYVSGVAPGPNAGQGQTGETLVTNKPDPFREFLLSLIGSQATTTKGQIPDYTLASLQNFTQNPSAAAEYFPELARPLLASLRPAEDREMQTFNDMFRKAGGTANSAMQSGAYLNEARSLIGDQANRREQLLAKEYGDLTGQLSQNMTNNIRAGLAVPDAQAATYRNLIPLATGISPLETRTQTTGVTQNIAAPGGAVTPEQQAQSIASLVSQYQTLNQPYQGF